MEGTVPVGLTVGDEIEHRVRRLPRPKLSRTPLHGEAASIGLRAGAREAGGHGKSKAGLRPRNVLNIGPKATGGKVVNLGFASDLQVCASALSV
ncbi:hypothetical protein [Aureimonas sp. AU20]|uniref:hypothetical protein n=1 Tax=Aureimonas sp. AU20 TaxID=1349819 RepID=UPI0011DFC4FA|nr:hypothetical protein [Aureimonas sp. AU20]